jgi:glycosyltransferase involved in cell wall biosynthesis
MGRGLPRIGIVSSFYGVHQTGGAERSLQLLAEALVARGWDVVVLTSGRNAASEEIGGLKVRRLAVPHLYWIGDAPEHRRWQRLAWHFRDTYNRAASDLMRRVLVEERVRLMHTHQLAGLSVAVWAAAHAARIPIMHTLRDYYLMCPRGSMYRRDATCHSQCIGCRALSAPRRWASDGLNLVTGISKHVLHAHLRRGYFVGVRSRIIPNTIAEGRPERPVHSDGTLRFLYVGRLDPAKGIESLLREFPDQVNISLTVCGSARDHGYEALLQSRYARRGVTFQGVVPVEQALAAADVLVVPSLWEEPFGRVVIEAFAQGRPVITSGRGGLGELVRQGETGLIYDAAEPGALGRTIRALAANPAAVRSMASDCLRAADRFRTSVVVPQYESAYEELLARAGAQRVEAPLPG